MAFWLQPNSQFSCFFFLAIRVSPCWCQTTSVSSAGQCWAESLFHSCQLGGILLESTTWKQSHENLSIQTLWILLEPAGASYLKREWGVVTKSSSQILLRVLSHQDLTLYVSKYCTGIVQNVNYWEAKTKNPVFLEQGFCRAAGDDSKFALELWMGLMVQSKIPMISHDPFVYTL